MALDVRGTLPTLGVALDVALGAKTQQNWVFINVFHSFGCFLTLLAVIWSILVGFPSKLVPNSSSRPCSEDWYHPYDHPSFNCCSIDDSKWCIFMFYSFFILFWLFLTLLAVSRAILVGLP